MNDSLQAADVGGGRDNVVVTDEDWDGVFKADIFAVDCTLQDLLPAYNAFEACRDVDADDDHFIADEPLLGVSSMPQRPFDVDVVDDHPIANNPSLDLAAMHPCHLETFNRENPRRSSRLRGLQSENSKKVVYPDIQPTQRDPNISQPHKRDPISSQPVISKSSTSTAEERDPTPPRPKKRQKKKEDEPDPAWLNKDGSLKENEHVWKPFEPEYMHPSINNDQNTSPAMSEDGSVLKKRIRPRPSKSSRKRRRGGKNGKNGSQRTFDQILRTLSRSDHIESPSFSLAVNASHSTTGWQGVMPPEMARKEIERLYYKKDDAEALYPLLKKFFRIPYSIYSNPSAERCTFVQDQNGLVFLFRSYRAMWLADMIDDLEAAQAILLDNDLKDGQLQRECATGGVIVTIYLPVANDVLQKPYLTLWHRDHEKRVELFLEQPIIKRIISWVSSIVKIVWPGLAARFEEEAAWHWENHGIKPLFGYFWNYCYNAAFPNQRRIHTGPHVDWKNQVGVCLILTYVLKSGLKFNHKVRGWIVLWEAGIAIELPPWTLTGYPSSLFFHFNIDMHKLQCVWTEPHVDKPTPENSHPFTDDDDLGRGSMVFFSQATMRYGPATGHNTLSAAKAAGRSRVADYDADIAVAFSQNVFSIPVPQPIIEGFDNRAPRPEDFEI
ncbi:hypothetical protein C8R43DRAFT_1136896 [Mycena crocata]|nr:hypothetical protein C8R43DRAFT_1136896 [Mycena crocata]